MDEKEFYSRWKRRYLRGLKTVAQELERCRKTGDAEAVHALRVAIRRTRLFAMMGRAVIGRKRVAAYRGWAQRLADALSPVRDYDVMIEWARNVCQDPEFARELAKDRKEAWRDARKALKGRPAEWNELRRLKADGKKRGKLAECYEKIAAETRALIEVDAAGFERLDATARHDFRRAVRRLKYLQELEENDEQKERLAKLQTLLGELQNAQAIKEMLVNDRNHVRGRRGLVQKAKRQESEWFTRCRRSIRRVMPVSSSALAETR